MNVPENQIVVLQQAATANGNGVAAELEGFDSAIQVEVVESQGGTATVNLEGSFDGGANWYAIGYYRVDGQATLTRAVTGVSVTANLKAVFQLLDPYPQVRARISAIASATVNVRAYCVA